MCVTICAAPIIASACILIKGHKSFLRIVLCAAAWDVFVLWAGVVFEVGLWFNGANIDNRMG